MDSTTILQTYAELYDRCKGWLHALDFHNYISQPNPTVPYLSFLLTNIHVEGQPTHWNSNDNLFYGYNLTMTQYLEDKTSRPIFAMQFNLVNVLRDLSQKAFSQREFFQLLFAQIKDAYSVYVVYYHSVVNPALFHRQPKRSADDGAVVARPSSARPRSSGGSGTRMADSQFTFQSQANEEVWNALDRMTQVAEKLI